jgi:hypothetical protein
MKRMTKPAVISQPSAKFFAPLLSSHEIIDIGAGSIPDNPSTTPIGIEAMVQVTLPIPKDQYQSSQQRDLLDRIDAKFPRRGRN